MKGNGELIKLLERVFTRTLMGQITQVNGLMTNNTAKVKNAGQTEQSILDNMLKERNMEPDFLNGQMVQTTMEILKTTTFMVQVSTTGLMEEGTKAHGSITKCMDEESLHGRMEESMSGIMLRIKRKATAFLLGLMVVNTWEAGKMESSMEKEPTLLEMKNSWA